MEQGAGRSLAAENLIRSEVSLAYQATALRPAKNSIRREVGVSIPAQSQQNRQRLEPLGHVFLGIPERFAFST